MANIRAIINLKGAVGSGDKFTAKSIGGKALGIAKIIKELPDLERRIEEEYDGDPQRPRVSVPDTYVILPSMYTAFKKLNLPEDVFERGDDPEYFQSIAELFWEGVHDSNVVDDLRDLLGKIDIPISIRSNQTQEDWTMIEEGMVSFAGNWLTSFFHNSFSSVEERVEAVTKFIAMTYLSNLSSAAYKRRGAEGLEEEGEMGIIIQPLVGQELMPGYFAPTVSGVLNTHNPIPLHDGHAPEDGMTTVVLGYGTMSVEETGVLQFAPGNPRRHSLTGVNRDVFDLAQKTLDVLDLEYSPELKDFLPGSRVNNPGLVNVSLSDLLDTDREGWKWLLPAISAYDGRQDRMMGGGAYPHGAPIATFGPWIEEWARLLNVIKEWGRDRFNLLGGEDFEFAGESKEGLMIYVNQLRPQATRTGNYLPKTPPVNDVTDPDRIVLHTRQYALDCRLDLLEKIIFVNDGYFNLGRQGKTAVSQMISKLNSELADTPYALIAPGRIGSRDLGEGVKVDQSDISNAEVLVGYTFADRRADFNVAGHFSRYIRERGKIPIGLVNVNRETPGQDNFLNYDLLSGAPNELEGRLDESLSGVLSVINIRKINGGRGAAVRGNREEGGTMFYLKTPSE